MRDVLIFVSASCGFAFWLWILTLGVDDGFVRAQSRECFKATEFTLQECEVMVEQTFEAYDFMHSETKMAIKKYGFGGKR